MTAPVDSRIAAPATGIRRQGIASRTAMVGLYVADTPLQRASVGLAEQGLYLPCWGRTEWTADDRVTRESVLRECIGCLVFAECGAEAEDRDEQFGVWASVDRTPR